MRAIVNEEDVIKTFSQREREAALAYLRIKNAPPEHMDELCKNMKLRKGRVRDWLSGKRKPAAIRIIEDLKSHNLLPLLADDSRLSSLARIMGAMFGDGSLTRTNPSCTNLSAFFFSKEIRVIQRFAHDIQQIFGPAKFSISQYEHGSRYGKSIIRYEIRSSFACRFLACLGVPVGDKVSQLISVPEWVMSSGGEIKRNFLDGLFSAELTKAVSQKNRGMPQMLRFSMSKIEELTQNHLLFLNNLRFLLAQLGIKSSGIFLGHNVRNRRDGKRSLEWGFRVANGRENMVNFFNAIPLTYAPAKKEALQNFLVNDPYITFKEGKAVYAPKTKVTIHGRYGGTTTVPSAVRRFLGVAVYDILYLTKREDNSVVVSTKTGECLRRVCKGWIIYIPRNYLAHLQLDERLPYLRWYHQQDQAIVGGD